MAPCVKRKEMELKKGKRLKKLTTIEEDDEEEEHLWLYCTGLTAADEHQVYEFHPALQEYIEKCYVRGKKSCKVNIFATEWTLDFITMSRSKRGGAINQVITRIPKSAQKKYQILGVSGGPYRKTGGFQQTEDLCNICLYQPTLPTRIDTCGHVFCFVCLKSNYNLGLECPTCRGRIPRELVDEPIVRCDLDIHVECSEEYAKDCALMFSVGEDGKGSGFLKTPPPLRRSSRSTRTKYYWIYQASLPGWYRYDPKNEKYLEECFARKKKRCTLFICGHNMTINFKDLVQERITDGEVHRRRIKRIKASDVRKHRVRGIAGIDTIAYPVLP